jgi:hypothetical protein
MTTATTPAQTVIVRDRNGHMEAQNLELELETTTPQQLIDWLISEGTLRERTPENQVIPYRLARGEEQLLADRPLADQGVQAGDELALLSKQVKG